MAHVRLRDPGQRVATLENRFQRELDEPLKYTNPARPAIVIVRWLADLLSDSSPSVAESLTEAADKYEQSQADNGVDTSKADRWLRSHKRAPEIPVGVDFLPSRYTGRTDVRLARELILDGATGTVVAEKAGRQWGYALKVTCSPDEYARLRALANPAAKTLTPAQAQEELGLIRDGAEIRERAEQLGFSGVTYRRAFVRLDLEAELNDAKSASSRRVEVPWTDVFSLSVAEPELALKDAFVACGVTGQTARLHVREDRGSDAQWWWQVFVTSRDIARIERHMGACFDDQVRRWRRGELSLTTLSIDIRRRNPGVVQELLATVYGRAQFAGIKREAKAAAESGPSAFPGEGSTPCLSAFERNLREGLSVSEAMLLQDGPLWSSLVDAAVVQRDPGWLEVLLVETESARRAREEQLRKPRNFKVNDDLIGIEQRVLAGQTFSDAATEVGAERSRAAKQAVAIFGVGWRAWLNRQWVGRTSGRRPRIAS